MSGTHFPSISSEAIKVWAKKQRLTEADKKRNREKAEEERKPRWTSGIIHEYPKWG